MDINTNFKSALSMQNLAITNACFEINNIEQSDTLSLELARNIEPLSDSISKVTLVVTITGVDNSLYIKVTCSGDFSIDNSNNIIPNNRLQQLIENNSIAIMFPYIRSYISTLTSVPNMNPIVLPPINVNKYISETSKEQS